MGGVAMKNKETDQALDLAEFVFMIGYACYLVVVTVIYPIEIFIQYRWVEKGERKNDLLMRLILGTLFLLCISGSMIFAPAQNAYLVFLAAVVLYIMTGLSFLASF
jgi:hypothetical protein